MEGRGGEFGYEIKIKNEIWRRIRKCDKIKIKSGGRCGDRPAPENVKSGGACNHSRHCQRWYDSLPNMTKHLICYGNIKIVKIPLNRKKGVYNRAKVWYYIIVGRR